MLDHRTKLRQDCPDGWGCDLIRNAPIGISLFDTQDRCTFMNDLLLSWIGKSLEEVLGKTPASWIATDHWQRYHEIRDSESRRAVILPLERDGLRFMVLSVAAPHVDHAGVRIGTCVFSIDLATLQTSDLLGIMGTLTDPPARAASKYWDVLSPREKEIARHLLAGERVWTIAKKLHVSKDTVRSHLKTIFRKTGTHSQSELINHLRPSPTIG